MLSISYWMSGIVQTVRNKQQRRHEKVDEKEVSCFSLAEQKKIEQAALSSKKRKFIGIVICLYSGLRIGFVAEF